MTLADWARETVAGYRVQSPRKATTAAVHGLVAGAGRHFRERADRPRGTPIWEQPDWDICCVLDACRWDLWAQVATEYDWLDAPDYWPPAGNVPPDRATHGDAMTSVGTQSPEWIHHTFAPRHGPIRRRTAYITGNPFSSADTPRWSHLPLVEGRDVGYLDEAWRSEWWQGHESGISTIPPRPLSERVIDAWQRRDELGIDRVVVHYMQPHGPFRSRPEWFPDYRHLQRFGRPDDAPDDPKDIWLKLRDGEVAFAPLWQAYKDNLRWVLDDVAWLRNRVDARLALTSDHGNAVGEWSVYSHPPGSPLRCLRTVPWATTEATRVVDASVSVDRDAGADGDVDRDAQLRALGYK